MVQLTNALVAAVVATSAVITVVASPIAIAESQLEARTPQDPAKGGLKGNPADPKYKLRPVSTKFTGAGPKRMHEATASMKKPREYGDDDELVLRQTSPFKFDHVRPPATKFTGAGPKRMHEATASMKKPREYGDDDELVLRQTSPFKFDHVRPPVTKLTGAGPKRMHQAAASTKKSREYGYDEADDLVRRENPPKSILKTSPSSGPKKSVRIALRGYDDELEVRELVFRELFGSEIDELD